MSVDIDIQSLIPHRKPMLLVDRVVELSPDRIVCRKTFDESEYFFQGHYPDYPLVPGVILCECGMQAGALLLAKKVEGSDGVPVATRLNDVKFKKMVRPGDTIEMQVELKEQVSEAFFLSARITCGGKLATRFEFACTLADVPVE